MPESRSAPVTVPSVRASKRRDGHPPLVMVTAYDAPGARIADAAGVDLILVGDSVAKDVLGYEDTLQVTVDDLAHHTAAVARAKPAPLIVADLPWMSYHVTPVDTVRNAARADPGRGPGRQAGRRAQAGPDDRGPDRRRDPGHGSSGAHAAVGARHGGFKVQGGTRRPPTALAVDAKALAAAGCFAMVLEGVPESVGAAITESVDVPTIGIGAGPACDGQVLVFHDLLGFNVRVPKFVRRYAELGEAATAAVAAYAADVRSGAFPADAEGYH